MRIKFFILTFLFLFFGASPIFADSVLINEIMAKPDDDIEWVELYNQTADSINLSGWKIRDGNSSSSDDLSLSGQILAGGFLAFDHSKGWLNDSGDETVSLLNGESTIDSYTYNGAAQGKTFARVPDGSQQWISNSAPSKNSTNGSVSPTATPSPSPTPTATPTDTPQSTSSFIISNTPSQINSDQAFSVNINLSMPNSQNTDYYLKGAFKKSDGTRYLGLSKNNNNWVEYGDDYSDQYKITTDSSGNWGGSLEVKPDTNDNDYKGSGDYIFKVGRFTTTGSGPTWSNETTLKINDVNGSRSSSNPTPQPTPKISPSSSLTKLTSPSSKLTPSIKNSYQIASVAGTQTATPEGKVEIKNQKQTNPFIWIGLIFIFAGAGAIGYIYLKKNANIRIKF